jgi:serine/threonine-protein kinase
VEQGKFQEAVEELRRGDELGSRQPGWGNRSALLRNAETLAALDTRLPALLKGREKPKDARERLALAQVCQMPCKKLYAAAARFSRDAFAEEPKLADDLDDQHRYNAACAAALAGCGQGNDAVKLDDKERSGLRRQALDWLRADIKAYRQDMEKSAGKLSPVIAQRMQHWLTDRDFNLVRGHANLAQLPEAERQEWQKLWQEVEALRQSAARQPTAASSARP